MHPPTPATGKLIHNLLCDCRVKTDRDTLLLQPQPALGGPSHLIEVLGQRQLLFCSTSAAFRRISRTPLPNQPNDSNSSSCMSQVFAEFQDEGRPSKNNTHMFSCFF